MSTRVQKGSQKFKPVVRTRPRVADGLSRQTSVTPAENNQPLDLLLPHDPRDEPNISTSIERNGSQALLEERIPLASKTAPVHVFAPNPQSQQLTLASSRISQSTPTSQTSTAVSGSSKGIPLVVPSQSVPRQYDSRPSDSVNDIVPTLLSILQSLAPGHPEASFSTAHSQGLRPKDASMSSITVGQDRSYTHRRQHDSDGGLTRGRSDDVSAEIRPNWQDVNSISVINRSRGNSTSLSGDEGQADGSTDSRTMRNARQQGTLSETSESPTDVSPMDSISTQPRRRKRQRSEFSSQGRRSRHPSLVPLDPNADPGEDLDPTVVTMAALCDDTGQGRVSSKAAIIQSNHQAWKTASREKRARMRAVMEAKKYGRREEDIPEAGAGQVANARNDIANFRRPSPIAASSNGSRVQSTASSETARGGPTGNGFDYSENLSTNRFNVQVRIGPNGETIIDEESLFVDRVENEEDTENMHHIEESDQTKFVNSLSYSKKVRGSRWSAEETDLFYDALSQFGENYELISYVLPGRDRKSCKNKFKIEDKKNPGRITYCLTHRIPVDIAALSRMTGKDFSGPTPQIIAPRPPALMEAEETVHQQQQHIEPEIAPGPSTKKARKTSMLPDSGLEIIGDIDSFEV